jgi:hypothetical protein
MKARTAWLALPLAGLTLYGACRALAPAERPAEDPALIANRVWVDSRPQKYTDYTQAMYVVGRSPIGIFEKASSYDLRMERFDYKRDGTTLRLHFPQSGRDAQLTFTIKSCQDLPPFDLCLELSDNPWGGPRKYYALSDQDDEEGALGARATRLRSFLDSNELR